MILLMVAPRGAATLLFMKEIKMSRNVNAINEDANRIVDMLARGILDLPPRNAGEKPITVKQFTDFTDRVNVQSCSPSIHVETDDFWEVLNTLEETFEISFVKHFGKCTCEGYQVDPSFAAQHYVQVMDFTKINRGTLAYRISVYYEDRQYFIVDIHMSCGSCHLEIFFDSEEDRDDFIEAFKKESFHEHTILVLK